MSSPALCPRETEVLDLVSIGQWPSRADADLIAHVAGCETCADLASVAAAMAELGENARMSVRVPDASVVWYRAQMAARDEITRRATRPMLVAQIAAVGAFLTGGFFAWQLGLGAWVTEVWATTGTFSWASLPSIQANTGLLAAASTWRWVALGLLAWTALIPAAFYLARVADRGGEPQTDRHHRA